MAGPHHAFNRNTLPPQSPIISRAASDINDVDYNYNNHATTGHVHTSTNPPQMHNLPDLLKLSEVDTPSSTEINARVSIHNKQGSLSPTHLKLKRKKTLPNKPLPNRPLPNKPLPNRPDRSHSHFGSMNMAMNQNNPNHNTQTITFNAYNHTHAMTIHNMSITPTRNQSRSMHAPPQPQPTHTHGRINRRRDPQHNHAPRNLMHIQTTQPLVLRSKTPEPRRSKPLTKRKVVTPTQQNEQNHGTSFAKQVAIQRLNHQYQNEAVSPQHSDSEPMHMNPHHGHYATVTDESFHHKSPPAMNERRKTPDAPRRSKPRKPKSKSSKTPPNANTTAHRYNGGGLQAATDQLRIQSTPNQNTVYNNYNNFAYNGTRSPKPMLSMSSTSITNDLDTNDDTHTHSHPHPHPHPHPHIPHPNPYIPRRKSKNMNAVSDTLWTIKQQQKRIDHQQQQYTANVEQLFVQQQQHMAAAVVTRNEEEAEEEEEEEAEEEDPQQAYLAVSRAQRRHHKGGSSMNLTKRISEHDRNHSEQQIAKAIPASFTRYQSIKKSYSLSQEQRAELKAEKSSSFIPPPPKRPSNPNMYDATSNDNSYDIQSSSSDEDDDTQFVDYLTRPSHVVMTSVDSRDEVLKHSQAKPVPVPPPPRTRHTRARSNSVPIAPTFMAITADNANNESDNDSNYSFSETPPPQQQTHSQEKSTKIKYRTRTEMIKNLKIATNDDVATPVPGTPFEMVHGDDDDDEDDRDEEDDTEVVVLQKERDTRSRTKQRRQTTQLGLSRSKSNQAPKHKHKSHDRRHTRRGSLDFDDVMSVTSAHSAGFKRNKHNKKHKHHKKKWYHGIFGGKHKVDVVPHAQSRNAHEMKDDLNINAWSDTMSLNSESTFDLTASTTAPSGMERVPIFSQYALSNRDVSQLVLQFDSCSEWNFNNDTVNVYRAQCATLDYASFIPRLAQIIYPTQTSSLSLPATVQSATYSVYCKYNLDSFLCQVEEEKTHQSVKVKVNADNIDMVSFEFSHSTTTRQAIKHIWHKICQSASYEMQLQLQSLELSNFVLKTCGREEYLRFNEILIVSSNYIRNCLRHNESQRIEFVLLYVHEMATYNDDKRYRKRLREWYRNNTYHEDIFKYYVKSDNTNTETREKVMKEKELKYENAGYNCIVSALIWGNTSGCDGMKAKLRELNLSVEREVDWLYSHIGSVLESNKRLEIDENKSNHLQLHHTSTHRITKSRDTTANGTSDTEQIEIDWCNIEQNAVLLDEFEHPIEIRATSLKNILKAPRCNKAKYDLILIRIELMFGSHLFDECSWDIRIPATQISNSIKIPQAISTFSSEIHQLYYSMLPREAVWCFTVYGVTENAEYAGDKKANKQTNKKVKLKHIDMMQQQLKQTDLDYSVSSQFKLFNGKGSTANMSRNRGQSVRSVGSSALRSSPYTPRGAQLKTKANYMSPYSNTYGANTSKSASESSRESDGNNWNSNINNDITVSLSSANADIIESHDIIESRDEEHDEMMDDDKMTQNTDDALLHTRRYNSEAIAWCRLPVVNDRHCINNNLFCLHLWSVPVFKYRKGGPKCDPYLTGFWRKFGTTTRNNDCDIILTIEFPHFSDSFSIVAPLVNPRRPEYVSRSIVAYKRREFPGKQVLLRIIEQDGITPLDNKDQMLVYSNKEKLMRYPEAIATFLRSVDWLDVELRMEAYDYLDAWCLPPNPEDMIELLRYEFADTRIRLYALNCLNELDDYTLNRYLLQLVQALKNELHHNSFLSRFLMYRAIRAPQQIGHYLFWHLLSEYSSQTELYFRERFGLLIEEYLLHLPPNTQNNTSYSAAEQLLYQKKLMNRLRWISQRIQYFKKKNKTVKKMTDFLLRELSILNSQVSCSHSSGFGLPISSSLRCAALQVSRCKFMSSAKAPLWLVFTNADVFSYLYPHQYQYKKEKISQIDKKYRKYQYFNDDDSNNDIEVMYKCGDDLRQDILILQLIGVMDAFWLNKNSDLRMKPYAVIQTGDQCGMLELILSARTTNDIHSKHGTIRGAFNHKAHLIYLKSNAQYINANNYKLLQENYARSCAGYSVATWVLGIGDRHPSNIMIHKNGCLFHIDFGHFLGNFKEKQIGPRGLIKFNRERSPFVFTSLMKYAIDEGIDDAQLYREFVQWIFKAYSEIRIRFKFFLNLFLLMIPSHMPQLIREYDVAYLRNALRLDLTSFQDIAIHVEKTIKHCLNDKYRLVDNGIHARKHAN